MAKKLKNLLLKIAVASLASFSIITTQTHCYDVAFAEPIPTNQTYGKYSDYYTIIGESNINKTAFPKIYKTTEKVYKGHGTSQKKVTVSDVIYEPLDGYKRSKGAYGIITKDMIDMSKGYREKWETNPEPSGWFRFYNRIDNQEISEKEYDSRRTKSYKVTNNTPVVLTTLKGKKYNSHLFVRSHLFADSLGGKSIRKNVITGTQMQNVGTRKGGMQYIEKKVLSHVTKNPDVHVFYSAIPEYQGTELLPRSVLVSALSSDGIINETIRVFNTADGFNIDYQKGGLLTEKPTIEDSVLAEDTAENEIEIAEDEIEENTEANTLKKSDENIGSQKTVYVASNGQSNVYWYSKESMPKNVNLNKVMEMSEQTALARGKHHSSTEKD
ncbi:DNA/RNA non-specific endonuclease [Streptococcus phocae]|uniref:Deoxyribonuclease n=1 Tax=Streptococcus phocae TaxID=119224 RepID=A0A0P6S6T2_9STRE|nr:DNA/RNA non-specific endonuclease [Streptococcus phocae]KPJ21942.1 deoxyribonuclease [Streptococcus phocae]